jgi:DNA-binding IscR family transcriptional regulator
MFVPDLVTPMISGKFAITLHILSLLSKYTDEFLSSEYIAQSLNINPVLVRKEICNLKKFDLVECKEGKNGGTKLLKPAEQITLEDIFRMTFEKVTLGYSKNEPNPACPVGKKINSNLESLYCDINKKISSQLSEISLLAFTSEFED